MNRREFIDELKKRLQKLPYDEIKEAVDYYERYFDDAGEENEQAVIAELGSPSAVSAHIIADFAVKGAGYQKSVRKNWHFAWLVILALFASPIAVPLALAMGLLAMSLIITISAVIFSFFAMGIAMVAGGIVCVVSSILIIFPSFPTTLSLLSFPTTLFLLGIGLVLSGVGTAIFIATAALSRKCFGWLAKQVGSFILSRRNS